jgi:anti-sigma B factor antagonist
MLTIKRTDDGSVTILELKGRINLGDGAVVLRKTIRDLVLNGRRRFVLVYEGVEYIDSSGNGELVTAYTTIRNAGGDVVLACLTQYARNLMQISKLLTVFDVYDTVDQAVASFKLK